MGAAAAVVFLRGANVGGARVFRPSVLAAELADLDVRSLGAAGTFVARGAVAAVRRRFLEALPIETEVVVRPGKEVLALVASAPFTRLPPGARGFVSVLARAPALSPTLPVERPAAGAWHVRVVEVRGAFALSVRRPGATGRDLYPNEVVERELGVPATTRGWDTFLRVAKALET